MGLKKEDFYTLADRTHFLGACLAIVVFKDFAKPDYIPWFGGALLVYAAIKEFWYDQNYEITEIRGSNLRDWVGYVLGWMAALLEIAAKTKWGH